jgi:hypothetical protein
MTGRMAGRGKASSDCKRRTGGAQIARVLCYSTFRPSVLMTFAYFATLALI